jgi:hypothetical protein
MTSSATDPSWLASSIPSSDPRPLGKFALTVWCSCPSIEAKAARVERSRSFRISQRAHHDRREHREQRGRLRCVEPGGLAEGTRDSVLLVAENVRENARARSVLEVVNCTRDVGQHASIVSGRERRIQ